jgi:predicted nucleic acid-binding protein
LDESLGRFHAKHARLRVTATIGILVKAKKQGLISELKPLILELKEKGVWLSENLIERILELANET